MMIGVEPQHRALRNADWPPVGDQTLVDADIQHKSIIQATIPAEVPASTNAYDFAEVASDVFMDMDTGMTRPRRPLHPTHSQEIELAAMRPRVDAAPDEAESAATTPSLDPSNPVEVALERISLHLLLSKLAAHQERFESYVETEMASMQASLDQRTDRQDKRIKQVEHSGQVTPLRSMLPTTSQRTLHVTLQTMAL